MPLVAGQRHELGILVERFGRDREVGLARHHHLRELVRVALQELQLHVGESFLERGHHRRQRIAGLRVRDAHREVSLRVVRELIAHRLQVGDLREDAIDGGDDLAPRVRHRGEAPALAHEDPGAELFFQAADLLGDTRLGRMERFGGLRDVEVPLGHLAHVA